MQHSMYADIMRKLRALIAIVAMSASLPALAQHAYDTPQAAAEALGSAIAGNDSDALKDVLGTNYRALLPEGGVHSQDVYAFLSAWSKHRDLVMQGDRLAWLAIGNSGWTFPAPIVKTRERWAFDVSAGQQEIRARKIGRNELTTVETLQALAQAQQRYFEQVGDGSYASRLVSRPGKTDGLYWPVAAGADASPVGADALAMGPDTPAEEAFYGYHYRMLAPGKGSAAKFAFIAWPAQYGKTGIHTYAMGSDRVIYEADLGPATAARAGKLRAFNTDAGWRQRAGDR